MRHHVGAVAALAFLCLTPARAQTNPLPGNSPVITKVTPNDVIAFLQGAGAGAQYLGEDSNGDKTIVATSGGRTAYVILRVCEGSGLTGRCNLVQPYGFFDAKGVTYDQMNNFSMNISINSFAGLFPDGRGAVVNRTYLNGGVAFEHVQFGIATLFADLDRMANAIKPGVIASVSWEKVAPEQGLTMPRLTLPDGSAPHVNAVGGGLEGLLTEELRAILTRGGVVLD
jgi:hypothetical protein